MSDFGRAKANPTIDSAGAAPTAEHSRLAESPLAVDPWRLWGPYVSGRQWGTVREDYSADGDAWNYFPFEQAHARAYRWGEDGLGGFCDRFGFLNLTVALWNGHDPILKERLFGLTNGQGNHGEDVKEYFWALDGTPTHSYAKWLYRYPHTEFPYARLRSENAARSKTEREFELADTGILADNRFFDVVVEYAKASPTDICILITATNHGPSPAPLDILPQLTFHNTWAWGEDDRRPEIVTTDPNLVGIDGRALECRHGFLGRYIVCAEGAPQVLLCDNETNAALVFNSPTPAPAGQKFKDGINARVVHGDESAVRTEGSGTKGAFWFHQDAVAPGAQFSIRLRLSTAPAQPDTFGSGFEAVLADRRSEADEFYTAVLPTDITDVDRNIARRAFAGLLWGKQVYRYDVHQWLAGDPAQPAAPPQRRSPGARNTAWQNLSLADVMSMPDEWEYPWFASWDLAFHCVALAHVDPAFAKDQLLLLCREWAMHPDGQLPAYEWAFGDVNPPVHAWAALQVYLIDGGQDLEFLMRISVKLLLNFSWWINRKDADGSNLFQGGFLGLDNIGLFNRSTAVPPGYVLEESDATSWMAFFCLKMLQICLELAPTAKAFDDLATKFLEHFLAIADAMRSFGSAGVSLWDEVDGFFYDTLVHPDGSVQPLRVRSMVGLIPLLAVAPLPAQTNDLADFQSRLAWLRKRRPELAAALIPSGNSDDAAAGLEQLSAVPTASLLRILARVFDAEEFFSPHGIRALSAAYRNGYSADIDGQVAYIDYEPGESTNALFGGNSNWRGPVWFPVNVLLADALRTHGTLLADTVTVPVPRILEGTPQPPQPMTLTQAADEIDQRLIALFRPGPDGQRPSDGHRIESTPNPLWAAHPTFSEYFHGDTGEGLGASHQTGWTALVAHLICQPNVTSTLHMHSDSPGRSSPERG